MIYFTGDMHGDKRRFGAWRLRWLGQKDALVVCGDFGFLWNGSQEEKEVLDWIGRRRYQVLFVEGTHDNLDLLSQYPVEEWNGGLVHHICGNLRHLIRGQVFHLQDKTLLALGGGESQDASFRKAGKTGGPRSCPSTTRSRSGPAAWRRGATRWTTWSPTRPLPTWIPASPATSARLTPSPPLWTGSSRPAGSSGGSSAPTTRTVWCR